MSKLEKLINEIGLKEFLTELIEFEKQMPRQKAEDICEKFILSKWCHSIFSIDELIEYDKNPS